MNRRTAHSTASTPAGSAPIGESASRSQLRKTCTNSSGCPGSSFAIRSPFSCSIGFGTCFAPRLWPAPSDRLDFLQHLREQFPNDFRIGTTIQSHYAPAHLGRNVDDS